MFTSKVAKQGRKMWGSSVTATPSRASIRPCLEVLEDRTMLSASSMDARPSITTASPQAVPAVANITSNVFAMIDQRVEQIVAFEQNLATIVNAADQVIYQEVVYIETQVGRIFGINPNPTISSTSSDSGSGRGNASGSGSGSGAPTSNNTPNQTLNNSTQPSGHGSGGGSSATTSQMPTGPAGMKAQPLDGGGSGSLFNGSGPGSGVTGSGTGSGPAGVSGQVWLDNNGNGNLDNGETGYQGITVNLLHFAADGSVDGEWSTTTDGDGDYDFNLELGPDAQTYAIQVVLGSATIPVVATIPGFSQIGPHGMSEKFQLANGGARFVEAGIRSMQVTTTQDDPGGAIHMQVTLRDAINTGNEFGGKFVTFADQAGDALNGTITLQAELPPIAQSFNIVGPGPTTLAVSGAGLFGVFEVYETSTISGLTIENGSNGNGAGFLNNGNLTLNSDVITGNQTTGNGGGIYNGAGALKLTGDDIVFNSAGGEGGGLYNNGGTVTIKASVISLNEADPDSVIAHGGGIENYSGTMAVSGGTVINSNSTGGTGGGVRNLGTFSMTGGEVSDNTADPTAGAGGGLDNAGGSMRLSGVQVQTNSAGVGGGISTWAGTLTLSLGTSITGNNKASTNGGGIYVGGGTVNMFGGGVTNNTAALDGGGIYVRKGQLKLIDGVLVSGNTSIGGGGVGRGGGIFISAGKVTVSGGTISNNTAAAFSGGGIYNLGGTLTLQASLVIIDNRANNQGGGIYLVNGSTTTFDGVIVSGNRTNGGKQTTGWGVYQQKDANVNPNPPGPPNTELNDEDDPNGNPVVGP